MNSTLHTPVLEDDASDERRNRILEHATQAFLAYGYDGANIEDIAIAAGVSKVTIYRYFHDKAGVVGAVMQKAAADMVAACRQELDSRGPIAEVLTNFAIRYITWMTHTIGMRPFYEVSRLVMEVSYHHPEITRAWHDKILTEVAEPFRSYVQSKMDAGVLEREDASFLMLHFLGSLFNAFGAVLAPPGQVACAPAEHEIAELAARKVRLFLNGCAAKSSRS